MGLMDWLCGVQSADAAVHAARAQSPAPPGYSLADSTCCVLFAWTAQELAWVVEAAEQHETLLIRRAPALNVDHLGYTAFTVRPRLLGAGGLAEVAAYEEGANWLRAQYAKLHPAPANPLLAAHDERAEYARLKAKYEKEGV